MPKNEPAYKLQSLAKCWEMFEKNAIPPGTAPHVIRRAKLAFYAGAAHYHDQTLAIGEVSDDAAEEHLSALGRELTVFAKQVEREEAARANG